MQTFQTEHSAVGSGTVRAMLSLTDHQASSIAAALPSLPGSWILDHHESYDGHLSVLLTAEGSGDDGPTYIVDRDGAGLHLRLLDAEAYGCLGTFTTIAELISALRAAMRPATGAAQVTHAA